MQEGQCGGTTRCSLPIPPMGAWQEVNTGQEELAAGVTEKEWQGASAAKNPNQAARKVQLEAGKVELAAEIKAG